MIVRWSSELSTGPTELSTGLAALVAGGAGRVTVHGDGGAVRAHRVLDVRDDGVARRVGGHRLPPGAPGEESVSLRCGEPSSWW